MKQLVLVACWCAVVASAPFLRRITLPYHPTAPNWRGSLYCPVDYAIQIDSIRISTFCRADRCSETPYNPLNEAQIRAKCTGKNNCEVEIRQKSNSDGRDLTIGYSCFSLIQNGLFRDYMVRRVTEQSPGPYCGRRRARDTADITRDSPRYSFDDMVGLRKFLAQNALFGYSVERPGNTVREVILRTRHHADGDTITLPQYVAADIVRTRDSSERKPFPSAVNQYMARCGKRGGGAPDDAGHLLAFTLFGDDVPSNLVPMARDLNRAQGIWYKHEQEIRQFLNRNRQGMVKWEVLVLYSVRAVEPHRPFGFVLRYTKYENRDDLRAGVERIEAFVNENEDYRNDQCTFGLDDFFMPANQQLLID